MSSGIVCGMAVKVSGMAGNTVATQGLTQGTANQRAIACAMTGLTGGMHLSAADKRRRGCNMTARGDTGCCRWCGQRINLHRSGMYMCMAVKERGMAGLAIAAGRFANGTTKQGAGSGTMTGQTSLARMSRMDSTGHDIGGGIVVMAAQAQGWSGSHVMGMAMAIKVGAMAGLAGGASGLANCAADQDAGRGTMTGGTTEIGMSLACCHIGDSGCRCVAGCTKGNCYHGMRMGMKIEITDVADRTVTTAVIAASTAIRHRAC